MIKPGDEPIAGYRLEALLGRGQFGQVWRARSPGNTTLALKFLELTGTHGWKEFRAIQRVKQIRHAHLMPIVAIWLLDEHGQVISDDAIDNIAASQEESDRHAASTETLVVQPIRETRRPVQLIVATLLANQTLGDRLRECQADRLKGIPVDELLGYMEEAAKGLDYLNLSEHKIGATLGAVQHCDVKPDNIMLAGGSVVISDFGVAQTLAQARQAATGTSLGGTPAYMAPECFANKPCTSTDQYSLAVTYYELRTGALPFREQTYAAVYKAHHDGDLDFSLCTPPEQQVLRKATAVEPKNRYASCAEFAEALREAVARKPAPKASPAGRFMRALAAMLILAGVGGGAFAAYHKWYKEAEVTPLVTPPIATAMITVVVDPPDAELTANGKPVKLDNGRAAIEVEEGKSLKVAATAGPDRHDDGFTIESVTGDEQRTIQLKYSAQHFATEADRLLNDGRAEEAVDSLAKAIAEDAGKYARLPEPAVRLAGNAPIERLQAAGDAASFVTDSRDGKIQRWHTEGDAPSDNGEEVQQHDGDLRSLAADESWVAALTDRGKIRLTPVSGQSIDLTVPEEAGEIQRIAIAGGGRWLIAASEVLSLLPPIKRMTTLHSWDLEQSDIPASRQVLAEFDGEFEPRLAAAHQGAWVVLSTMDDDSYVVRVCRADAPETPEPIYRQSGELIALAVAPDDRLIALGGGSLAADEGDFRATLIDPRTKRHFSLNRGFSESITAIAFGASGRFLAIGSFDGHAHAWTIPDDWDAAAPLGTEPVFLDQGHEPISAIACPRDGWVVCNHSGEVVVWDCSTDLRASATLAAATDGVTAIAAPPGGNWIVTGHEAGTLKFWPMPRLIMVLRACAKAGQQPHPPETSTDQVTRSDRSAPRGSRSLSGSAGSVRPLWNHPIAAHGG